MTDDDFTQVARLVQLIDRLGYYAESTRLQHNHDNQSIAVEFFGCPGCVSLLFGFSPESRLENCFILPTAQNTPAAKAIDALCAELGVECFEVEETKGRTTPDA